MQRFVIGLGAVALGLVLAGATPACADEAKAPEPQTGTVVAVEEDTVTVKGADGKEYEIDLTIVAAEDLKTGDMVEYGLVNEQPVRVKKKAK